MYTLIKSEKGNFSLRPAPPGLNLGVAGLGLTILTMAIKIKLGLRKSLC